jgi:hypothetical protein
VQVQKLLLVFLGGTTVSNVGILGFKWQKWGVNFLRKGKS